LAIGIWLFFSIKSLPKNKGNFSKWWSISLYCNKEHFIEINFTIFSCNLACMIIRRIIILPFIFYIKSGNLIIMSTLKILNFDDINSNPIHGLNIHIKLTLPSNMIRTFNNITAYLSISNWINLNQYFLLWTFQNQF